MALNVPLGLIVSIVNGCVNVLSAAVILAHALGSNNVLGSFTASCHVPNSSVNYIVWLLLSVLVTMYGDYLSKKFALSPSWRYVVIISIVYAIGTLFWLPAILQKNELSIVGAMWAVMLYVGIVSIGLIIFKETVSSFGILGIILGLISIIFLSLA